MRNHFALCTKLSIRSENYLGMNLTQATLAATLKYPWFHGNSDDHKGEVGML